MITTTSKNNWFCEQNNCSACASHFLVHFFDVHCTTMMQNLPLQRFMEDVDILQQIFPSLFDIKPLRIQLQEKLPTFDKLSSPNRSDKRMQIHLSFLVMFSVHCHHHHHCLRSLLTQMEERGITNSMFRNAMIWKRRNLSVNQ